jgi:Flp pilus assembly protein TadG
MLKWRGHHIIHCLSRLSYSEEKAAPGRSGVFRVEGAAIIEFAVCAAVLLALMVGIMELCFGLYAYHATDLTAREASRWAMVRGSTSCTNTANLTDCNATAAEIQTYASTLGFLNITTSDVTVTWLTASATQPTTWSTCSTGTCNVPGNQVQVKIAYPYTLGIPFVSSQALSLSSTSAMVIAQ